MGLEEARKTVENMKRIKFISAPGRQQFTSRAQKPNYNHFISKRLSVEPNHQYKKPETDQ